MEKFNRSTAREISQRVQEALSEMFKSGEFEFTINGGNFTEDKLKLNLEVRLKNEDGTMVVSEATHRVADLNASRDGLKFEGHVIGSTWTVKGAAYTVMEYSAKRSRYPFSLKRSDGKLVNCGAGFLMQGTQCTVPTQEDFVKWFTMDPDSDAILESDATICDRVQAYLENNYPVEDGDKFFSLVDKFNENGIAKKWANRAYELLFKEKSSMATAYLGMRVIFKEVTRPEKPRNTRKSKSSAK